MPEKRNIIEIYDAAFEVFAEYGYNKTNLADIAEKLGMTSSNLYRYVKSKKDLYEQSVSHALRQWQAFARDAISPGADAQTQFIMMSLKAVEYLSINDTFRQLLVRDPSIFPIFPENDPYEKINADSLELVKSVLIRGIESDEFHKIDVEMTSQILWLIYKTFIMQIYVKKHGKTMMDSWKVFIDLITNGFLRKPDRPVIEAWNLQTLSCVCLESGTIFPIL